MCIICVHYEKEKMSMQEAYRALGEMRETLEPEHVEEIEQRLRKDAMASSPMDDAAWEYYWEHFDYLNTDYFGSD